MPGAEKHNVCADPLTPYWRQLVDEAAQRVRDDMVRFEDRRKNPVDKSPRQYPAQILEEIPIAGRPAEDLFVKMWCAGVPATQIAVHFQLSSPGRASVVADTLRARGRSLPHRGSGWRPPFGWQARLDDILKDAG